MAMEYETALSTDSDFASRRIDELLASAIEDQAREQRMMIETVTGARKALAAAQTDLSALRSLIESRDQNVIDMLEARLAGVASQEGIDAISKRLEPVEHYSTELAERLERIVEPLNGVRNAINSLADGMDALREHSKIELEQLTQRSHEFEGRLRESVEAQEQAISAKLTLSQNSLAERIEDKQERFNSQQTEMLEAAITELQGTMEEILRASAGKAEEILRASDETIRQELRQELQNFGARTFDRIQKLRDDVGSYEKMIQDLPMLVDEHLVAHREAQQASDSSMSRQLEQMRRTVSEMDVTVSTRFDRVDKEITTTLAETQQTLATMVEESNASFDGRLESIMSNLDARLEAVVQTVSAQAPEIAESLSASLQPFVDQMSKITERVRQTNRRMTESNSRMEAMHESLIAYLSQRDEHAEITRDAVLKDLIEHMAEQLGRKDRVRVGQAFREADQRRKDRRDAERYRKMTKKKKSNAVTQLEEMAAEIEEASEADVPQSEDISIDLAAAESEPTSDRLEQEPIPSAKKSTPPRRPGGKNKTRLRSKGGNSARKGG